MKSFWPSYKDEWKNGLVVGVGAVATVVGLITLVAMLFAKPDEGKPPPDWPKYALAFWVVVPPLCFWSEYWLLWRHEHPLAESDKDLERFKYAQGLGRNVWLAFAILLGAFFFENKPSPGHDLSAAKLEAAAAKLEAAAAKLEAAAAKLEAAAAKLEAAPVKTKAPAANGK